MNIKSFSGGAGCGKTYQLIQALSEWLILSPLQKGQKVLALTFMHGSRRRLDERLRSLSALEKKYECSTLDSFAYRIVRRWQSLVAEVGLEVPGVEDYEKVCDAAAAVLKHEIACRWVAATFPLLLVDEAQDLSPARLKVVRLLSAYIKVIAAADEFQCLDESLRPNPAYDWLVSDGELLELTIPRRTSVPALIKAAADIRSGRPPISDGLFKIKLTPKAPFAGSWIANNIGWFGQSSKTAIITPVVGEFAKKVIEWVGGNTTKFRHGPYFIEWEISEVKAFEGVVAQLNLQANLSSMEILEVMKECVDSRSKSDVIRWLDLQRRTQGKDVFSKLEIERVIQQSFSNRRRNQRDSGSRCRAMTVHGAKNREFDNVVILWPASVVGSDDQKRRLLYNALTRAKQRCLVLVQSSKSLTKPPFK
ncbi:MAG: hypothetical protein JWM78_2942 [Verrucomicrobiaceae bacterium]|nr:hypothetical protein [Verrucomicrobiaceae bacterium]